MNRPVPRISRRTPFFDKLTLWVTDPLDRSVIAALRRMAGSVHPRMEHMPYNPEYQQKVDVCQPSTMALRFLRDVLQDSHHTINYLELANDMETEDPRHLPILARFFDMHLVKKWPGKRGIAHYEGTRYTNRRGNPNGIVLYSDTPSKVTGEPCVHLEWRFSGIAILREHKLCTLEQLLAADHRAFWEDRLVLRGLNLAMLAKQFLGDSKAKKPREVRSHGCVCRRDWYTQAGHILLQAIFNSQDAFEIPVQSIASFLKRYRWFHPETALMNIPTSLFLPDQPHPL